MHRKMKALGVAMVALFALGAVAASSAFAAEGAVTPGATPATITGSQVNTENSLAVGSTGARTINCTTIHKDSTSTTSGPTNELIFGFTESGCTTSPGGGPATVSSTNCDTTIKFTEKLSSTSGKGSGALISKSATSEKCDLIIVANSTAGSKICEYTIAPQTAGGSILWESKVGTSSDVVVDANGSTVTVNVLSGTLAACGAGAGGSTSGKLSGKLTLTAEVGAAATSLTVS
jgi:hypothetical protein